MNLVALLRRPEPLEAAVESLARCAGMAPAEARARLAGDLPRVAAVLADRAAADAMAKSLAAAGFAATVVPAAMVESDAGRDVVSAIALGPDGIEAALRGGGSRTLAYAGIALVLHGARTSSATSTVESTSKSFSAGRALLTGGLVMNKTTSRTETKTASSSQSFAYLYPAEGGGPVVALYERNTNYAALGPALQPSSLANFNTVLAELRRRAPGARVDGRLARPFGLGVSPLPPPGRDAGEWKADVAAALIAAALR